MANRLTKAEFVQRAQAAHGNRYQYHLANYRGMDYHVTIVCPRHGSFQQLARVHVQGSHCPECVRESRRIAIEENTNILALSPKTPLQDSAHRSFWDKVFYPVDRIFTWLGFSFMNPDMNTGKNVIDSDVDDKVIPRHFDRTEFDTLAQQMSSLQDVPSPKSLKKRHIMPVD